MNGPQLPLDYTFCEGLDCDRKEWCARHLTPTEQAGIKPWRRLSMAMKFERDESGHCRGLISRQLNDARPDESVPGGSK